MKYTTLKEHHLYNKTFRKGSRQGGKYVSVFVLRDYAARRLAKAHPEKKTVNRIGLTTSTKLGGAVVRSRCRRIMREGLRALEKERPLKTGFLIVIAARSAATSLKSDEIKNQLSVAFEKLGMYRQQ